MHENESSPSPANALAGTGRHPWRRVLVCAGIFAWLAAWVLLWPYTGDGDSAMHYLNLRETWNNPVAALSAWARPLYVVIMVGPARGGIFGARLFAAALSALLAWQTMRLADNLKIRRGWLAGLLLIWQPLFFALAADTMTEMPMALGIVICLRLWWSGRKGLALFVAGLLPLIRPEGLLLLPMWGVLALVSRDLGHWLRRLAAACLLASGVLAWIAACWILTGNALWFLDYWSWPLKNYDSYGSGHLLHHVYLWPYYTGPVLIVLFLAGLKRAANRRMALPWAIWLIVFVAHSLMWWLGICGAIGLMRIQTVTASISALVCLYGWNTLADLLARKRVAIRWRYVLGIAAACIATGVPIVYHWQTPDRHRCRPVIEATRWIKEHDLDDNAPKVFTGEHMVIACLDMAGSPRIVENVWNAQELRDRIAALPPGSIGVWDNQRSLDWYAIAPEEIPPLGYEVLHRVEYDPGNLWVSRLFQVGPQKHVYLVLRKKPSPESQPAPAEHEPLP